MNIKLFSHLYSNKKEHHFYNPLYTKAYIFFNLNEAEAVKLLYVFCTVILYIYIPVGLATWLIIHMLGWSTPKNCHSPQEGRIHYSFIQKLPTFNHQNLMETTFKRFKPTPSATCEETTN